jgi:hypothetical protein
MRTVLLLLRVIFCRVKLMNGMMTTVAVEQRRDIHQLKLAWRK